MKNLYEVMGVANFSNVDELKQRYHQLALQHHPDKLGNNSNCSDMFQCVNEAWKLLQNEQEKKEYDVQLSEYLFCQQSEFIHDSFTVDEVATDWYIIDDDEYVYDCRCGGMYTVDIQDLQHLQHNFTVSCDSCSLLIRITTT